MASEWERMSETERGFWDGLKKPLRWLGWGFGGLGVLLLAVLVLDAIDKQRVPPPVDFVFPAIVGGIGGLCLLTIYRIRSRRVPQLATVFSWLFIGAGLLMIAGGVAGGLSVTIEMFWLLPFGLPFIGAGFVARKLFKAPEGKKAVDVQTVQTHTRNTWGQPTTVTQAQTIYVDEYADAAEVEAEAGAHKRNLIQHQWQARADWAAGRIQQESIRQAGRLQLATALYAGVAGVLVVIALWQREWLWIFLALMGVGIASILAKKQFSEARQRRRFAPSYLVLANTPAFSGEALRATVETGVRQSEHIRNGFVLTLECVHRWAEAVDNNDDGGDRDRTEHHRDVLWSATARPPGTAYDSNPACLAVPVAFDLPADQPATTLGGTGEGISWELKIEASLEDTDYSADFKIPVLERADEALFADASAGVAAKAAE